MSASSQPSQSRIPLPTMRLLPADPAFALDAETCALLSLAHLADEAHDAALEYSQWLLDRQLADGSVCMWGDDAFPKWPTSLAMLAWKATEISGHQFACERAIGWTLSLHGDTMARQESLGHDTTLAAWPWVGETHSWIEPTSLHIVALKFLGHASHARVDEAIRMLVDRQLDTGGCNYGNTEVLGQTLRPHVQPTGLAMLALSGIKHAKVEQSLRWLESQDLSKLSVASASWAAIGMKSHGIAAEKIDEMLVSCWEDRSTARTSFRETALMHLALHPPTCFTAPSTSE